MSQGLLTRPAARAVAPAPQRHRVWRTLAKAADASANSEVRETLGQGSIPTGGRVARMSV